MRSLWISILSLSLLIGSWGVFYHFSDQKLSAMIDVCSDKVMPAILAGDWDKAEEAFGRQYDNWHDYKKYALFFSDTLIINDTDTTMAKTFMYIHARDDSNSSGELLALAEQMRYLQNSEKPLIKNIL